MLRVSSLHRLILAGLVLAAYGCSPADSSSSAAPSVTATTPESHDAYFPLLTGPHAGTDCDQCHGDFDTFTELSCIGCHEHREEATSPQHDGLSRYTYTGRSCVSCHPRGEAEGAANHEQIFPIAAGTPHGNETCSGCHLDANDRTQVTCIDCHAHAQTAMAESHAAIAAFEWSTAACRTCHPMGDVLAVEHESIFPIAPGSDHAAATCSDCHVTPGSPEHIDCRTCHEHQQSTMSTAHGGVGGYRFDTGLCLRCHHASDIPIRLLAHTPFRIDGQAKHRPSEAACLQCHRAQLPARPFPSTDWLTFDCAQCHSQSEMDRKHREERDYRYYPVVCLDCHPDGTSDDD